jgi:hypothetical protein
MLQLRPARTIQRSGRVSSLLVALSVFALSISLASAALGATFDPTKIISDDNMRAYDCLSQSDIQAFLDTQKGPLKSLVTTDYAGTSKPAAQIIAEACKQWKISPKVMLTMLQKEQSLLTRTSLLANTLSRAIGAGCPGGPTNKYPGFGQQMWYGARLLDGYGEGKNGSTIALWKAPYTVVNDIYVKPNVSVKTANVATYKLFIYNPSIGAKTPYGDLSTQSSSLSGNANFWMIYRKNFGDTFANPAKRTVYRFRDVKNGSYFWTARESERHAKLHDKRYKYEAVAFTWDTSDTVCPSAMYRFFNRRTKAYLFTSSCAQRDALRSGSKAKVWRFESWGFKVSYESTSSRPVYWFSSKKTGLPFFSTSTKDKSTFSSATYRKKWRYRGIAFYVPK